MPQRTAVCSIILCIYLAAAAATVLDVMEVLRQWALANGTLAILAMLVALTHAAIAVLAVLVLRGYGGGQRQGSRVA
jgi:pheromone shutdown protein TraB